MDSDDEELKDLLRKIAIWLGVVVVFGGMFIVVLVRRFGSVDSSLNEKIDSQTSVTILVETSASKKMQEIKYELNRYGIHYELVSKERKREFNNLCKLLEVEDIQAPAVIHIENRRVVVYLDNIQDLDDLKPILEYNIQSRKER